MKIKVTRRDGTVDELNVEAGISLMDALRDGGVDEVLALCGGCCSCATCHVHIDEKWLGTMPPVTSDEDDLLDSSEHRGELSRLSCQVQLTPAMEGMEVQIAEED